jgi:hypothetical protein
MSQELDARIDKGRSDIRTDKLDMTFGEFASMYERGELIVTPAYQRLFRWKDGQKGRFIESVLLGIPTPAIFVAETEDGLWELVDGLQRLSTILEFFGILKDADGNLVAASQIVADEGAVLPELDGMTFETMSLRSRLSIRRAGCRVEVVKVGSGKRMKYDLFERLNTGGVTLTDQEIRNCIFRAEAPDLMEYFDQLALLNDFSATLELSQHKRKSLYDRGLVLRFFALKNDFESFRHHVEPFVTDYVHKIVNEDLPFDRLAEEDLFKRTFARINAALGEGAWKYIRNDATSGEFSVYIFEAMAVAVAANIDLVEQMTTDDLTAKLNQIKVNADFKDAIGPGGNTKPKLTKRLQAAAAALTS